MFKNGGELMVLQFFALEIGNSSTLMSDNEKEVVTMWEQSTI